MQQELEDNRGVSLHLQLSAAPADMASAAARGIRRAADKLVLPPSAGASLLNQSASNNGAMLFEVAASNGGRTHAGVLEVRPPCSSSLLYVLYTQHPFLLQPSVDAVLLPRRLCRTSVSTVCQQRFVAHCVCCGACYLVVRSLQRRRVSCCCRPR